MVGHLQVRVLVKTLLMWDLLGHWWSSGQNHWLVTVTSWVWFRYMRSSVSIVSYLLDVNIFKARINWRNYSNKLLGHCQTIIGCGQKTLGQGLGKFYLNFKLYFHQLRSEGFMQENWLPVKRYFSHRWPGNWCSHTGSGLVGLGIIGILTVDHRSRISRDLILVMRNWDPWSAM